VYVGLVLRNVKVHVRCRVSSDAGEDEGNGTISLDYISSLDTRRSTKKRKDVQEIQARVQVSRRVSHRVGISA